MYCNILILQKFIYLPDEKEEMGLFVDDLKESNNFLNVLFNSITSAIFLVGKDLKVLNFNDSFKVLFNDDGRTMVGQLCGNAIGCINTVESNADCGTTPNCEECLLRQSLIQTFTVKVPVNRALLVRQFKVEGKIVLKYFQFSTRYIYFNNEEIIVVIVDDVTETEEKTRMLSETNEKLLDLNIQRNQLLGTAAHDLRNPLSVINSYSEILIEAVDSLKPENLKEILKIINNSSHFTLQLLNDLLDYSKIESGTVQLKKVKINYVRFVQDVVSQNEFLSLQKNIAIHFEALEPEIVFMFDFRRLEQVLNNLIGNAIKYSFPGNDVKISVFRKNGFVVTSVQDNGQGIPAKDIPHLFEPFRQVSVKATQNEKGSGLGLAIVKKIIDFHEGNITVHSHPGEGSTFTFYLPE
jgi:signal transduction histidine kinase